MQTVQIIVVTGLSGSGKSTAIRALEDLGFVCVDNMPVVLLPRFLDLLDHASKPTPNMALVIDAREGSFIKEAEATFRTVKAEGHHLEIVFLEADNDTLLRRYSETRRKHPLSPHGNVESGVRTERATLADLRHMADHIIDTTDLNVHDLRRAIQDLFDPNADNARRLIVNVVSFGFKAGLPRGADLVFDVRFLLNPHFVAELRPKTGIQPDVARYVLAQPNTSEFLNKINDLLEFLLPLYEAESKAYLTIAFGCTGGQHRSVSIAEHVAATLAKRFPFPVNTHHRDLPR